MLSKYWNFVTRPPPPQSMDYGLRSVDNFVLKLTFWTCFFSAVYILSTVIPKLFFPKWFNNLPERKRAEWPSYVISSVHHVIMVPLGWFHIYDDFLRTEEELLQVDYSVTEGWIAPISMGYLLGDTICYAVPELLHGHWEYLVHHGFTLWFVTYCFMIPGHVLRYIPHFLVCDTTNIIFNACWFLRLTELRDSALVKIMEICFAIQFFLLRNVNLSIVIAMFWMHGFDKLLGLPCYLVLPVGALQWYWLWKIVKSMTTRLSPKKEA